MATYESPRYKELGFYVDGGFRRFSGGLFHTDDPAEIAVLDALVDVVRKPEEPQVVAEINTEEVPVKPTPKPRKASATASAK